MSIDYVPKAGIGIKLTNEMLRDNFKIGFDSSDSDYDINYRTCDELEDLLEGTNIEYKYADNGIVGELYDRFLVAKDPVMGLTDFISDLKSFGINVTKIDLSLLESVSVM